jgi:hypothetical protein
MRIVFHLAVAACAGLLPSCGDGEVEEGTPGDVSGDHGNGVPDADAWMDGNDDEADTPTCVSPPASLDDCFVGDFFAECGARGSSTLACSPSARSGRVGCYWFDGPCVPAGFEASECSGSDLCCLGGWPFDGNAYYAALHPYLLGYGREPWSAERAMALDVVVDPSLTSPAETSVSCNGAFDVEDSSSPCVGGYASLELPGTLVIRLEPTGGAVGVAVLSGWQLLVEVDVRVAKARACQYLFSDTTPGLCADMAAPLCAEAGELRLSHVPNSEAGLAGLTGELHATFDGIEIVARF